jgi:hypothetical protein
LGLTVTRPSDNPRKLYHAVTRVLVAKCSTSNPSVGLFPIKLTLVVLRAECREQTLGFLATVCGSGGRTFSTRLRIAFFDSVTYVQYWYRCLRAAICDRLWGAVIAVVMSESRC